MFKEIMLFKRFLINFIYVKSKILVNNDEFYN